MNMWIGPPRPKTGNWRYFETAKDAIQYIKQHTYNGKIFVRIKVLNLLIDKNTIGKIIRNFPSEIIINAKIIYH